MARRQKGGGDDDGGANDWLATYSDMVTLILTFFILLYSMSSVDSEKWQKLVESFSRTSDESSQIVLVPEGTGDSAGKNQGESTEDMPAVDVKESLPENFDELYLYLKQYIEENEMEGSVELVKQDNSVFIRFHDNIFFNPDNYTLKRESYPLMEFMGDCFKSIEDEILVICINGHTADVKIENYPVSARRLSSQRADSVAIYFEETKLISSAKIVSRGYANNVPIDTNETPEGRRKNRRVDITIVSSQGSFSDVDDLFSLINGTVDVDSGLDKKEPIGTLIPENASTPPSVEPDDDVTPPTFNWPPDAAAQPPVVGE